MDIGAIRSCINYSKFCKLNVHLAQHEVPRVMGADGGDLGSMGSVELILNVGVKKVKQEFIICRELRRNIILGVDFAKCNCAGIQWTTSRTRTLSLNGLKAVEVEEDELGIPVTALYHIRVPPRHNAVFEVNIHVETEGTQIITGNKHLLEKHPNMYQYKIAIRAEENSGNFQLMAITNLDQVKTLHLAKGEVVGFARPESPDVTYIATTNELNIEETLDIVPINWVPQRKWNLTSHVLRQPQAMASECSEFSQKSRIETKNVETSATNTSRKGMTVTFQKPTPEFKEDFQKSWKQPDVTEIQTSDVSRKSTARTPQESIGKFGEDSQKSQEQNKVDYLQDTNNCSEKREVPEHLWKSTNQQWCNINEVIESDFLISLGDIYPNRKVELEDADIKDKTKAAFEVLCEEQHKAFSKNVKVIGHTQLIEMEIDTGESLPVAQSPYTLPLKHYDWVLQEIETLEKSGVIERSLSRWA